MLAFRWGKNKGTGECRESREVFSVKHGHHLGRSRKRNFDLIDNLKKNSDENSASVFIDFFRIGQSQSQIIIGQLNFEYKDPPPRRSTHASVEKQLLFCASQIDALASKVPNSCGNFFVGNSSPTLLRIEVFGYAIILSLLRARKLWTHPNQDKCGYSSFFKCVPPFRKHDGIHDENFSI